LDLRQQIVINHAPWMKRRRLQLQRVRLCGHNATRGWDSNLIAVVFERRNSKNVEYFQSEH